MGANKDLFPMLATCNQIQFSIPFISNSGVVNPRVAKSRLVKRTPEEIKAIRNPAYEYVL